MNAEKTFIVNFGSGSVEMNNFEYFEESIFENTFNSLSNEARKALVDDEEAMLKYIDTLDEVYQDGDEAYATLPLSAEEKKLAAEHLRIAIIELMADERMLMNPQTGSVAPETEWRNDFEGMTSEEWGGENFEDGGLIEVVRNTEGEPGYDPNYGEWKETNQR